VTIKKAPALTVADRPPYYRYNGPKTQLTFSQKLYLIPSEIVSLFGVQTPTSEEGVSEIVLRKRDDEVILFVLSDNLEKREEEYLGDFLEHREYFWQSNQAQEFTLESTKGEEEVQTFVNWLHEKAPLAFRRPLLMEMNYMPDYSLQN
jgi:hypothetical protein